MPISHVAGFTGLSERLAPAELVRIMNRYLTEMTEAIPPPQPWDAVEWLGQK